MANGVAVAVDPPETVGTALAVITAGPLTEGLQEHVATNGEVAADKTFLQPGINLFWTLKETFEAALTFAVIVTAKR